MKLDAGRIAIIAVVVLLVSGCASPGPSSPTPSPTINTTEPRLPAQAWTEVMFNWTRGTNLTWKGETYSATPDDEWATDGWTYLYAHSITTYNRTHAECERTDPPTMAGPVVFIGLVGTTCVWAPFPSPGCAGASFCPSTTRPGGPGPMTTPE